MIHQFKLQFVLSTIPRDCSAYSNECYSNFVKENCQDWVRHRNLFFIIVGVELTRNAILIGARIQRSVRQRGKGSVIRLWIAKKASVNQQTGGKTSHS